MNHISGSESWRKNEFNNQILAQESQQQFRSYTASLNPYLSQMTENKVVDIAAYEQHLKETNHSPETIRKALIIMRAHNSQLGK